MIAIEPASFGEKSKRVAPINVINIPICAAAPSIKLFGLAMSGPKSVMAPIPKNISGGNIPRCTP